MANNLQEPPSSEEYNEISLLKYKTMKKSIQEGALAGISLISTDNFIIPYALALGASNAGVGILNSTVGLVSPTSQIIGSRLMERYSRRRLLVSGVALQASMFLLLLLLGVFYFSNVPAEVNSFQITIVLILFYALYVGFGNIVSPVWFSLMGDIVPEEQRGRYFAKRNIICTAIPIAAILLFSFILDYYTDLEMLIYGFAFIFVFSFLARLISAAMFRQHHYPPFRIETYERVTLKQFFREIPQNNFGRFALFVALMNLGQMIAGPFFSIYMLEELQFNYVTFITINLSLSFFSLFMYSTLGKIGDRYGNVRLLRFGAIILPFLPFLWLFFDSPFTIIFVIQLLGALGWTAFNLATSNFIYDNVAPHQRGYYVAYYNFLIGIGILAGGLFGSFLIDIIPNLSMNPFQVVFFLSFLVRLCVILLFLPRIKEVRKDILETFEKREQERVLRKPRYAIHFIQSNIQRGWLYEIFYERRKRTPKGIRQGGIHRRRTENNEKHARRDFKD